MFIYSLANQSAGIMVFNHNFGTTYVSGYESPYSYSKTVVYDDVTVSQIAAVADVSGQCSQYIEVKYFCDQ